MSKAKKRTLGSWQVCEKVRRPKTEDGPPRTFYVDPKNPRRCDLSSCQGILEAFGYETCERQQVAMANWACATDWLHMGYAVEGQELLHRELASFLKAAGLRGPHYKPADDANDILVKVHHAFAHSRKWKRAVKRGNATEAGQAAYVVASWCETVTSARCAHIHEHDRLAQNLRRSGGRVHAKAARERHAKWQTIADAILARDPFLASKTQLAKRVREELPFKKDDPRPNWRTIFNSIRTPKK